MSLSFEVDEANREVVIVAPPEMDGLVDVALHLSESDLIEMLSRLQASDSTLAEQAGL